ncbi:hydroxylase [Mycolicibacterium sp. XJ870]
MTWDVTDNVREQAAQIAALGPTSEALGRLDARVATILRDSGVTRMLQPTEHGGLATHPRDFAETVVDIARRDGSAGWVAGALGLPPWELAMADRRVRDEVWEADPGAWVASAYVPSGTLTPVDDGYLLSGRWQFVAAIDHCDWALLATRSADGGHVLHAVVPRTDVSIVDGSWDVVGLSGIGGKDIVVIDAEVPGHRVLDCAQVVDGTAAELAGLRNPMYHIPFSTMLPLGITAAVLGMAEGALDHLGEQEACTAESAADLRASRLAVLDSVSELYHRALDGPVGLAMRARSRRDQLQAVRRAVRTVDEIVCRATGDALRRHHPLQRFWRDAHMGLALATSMPEDALLPAVLDTVTAAIAVH